MPLNNYFENNLKNAVEQFYMYPSSHLWDNIANGLRINNKLPNKRPYNLFILAGFLTIAFNFFNHNTNKNKTETYATKAIGTNVTINLTQVKKYKAWENDFAINSNASKTISLNNVYPNSTLNKEVKSKGNYAPVLNNQIIRTNYDYNLNTNEVIAKNNKIEKETFNATSIIDENVDVQIIENEIATKKDVEPNLSNKNNTELNNANTATNLNNTSTNNVEPKISDAINNMAANNPIVDLVKPENKNIKLTNKKNGTKLAIYVTPVMSHNTISNVNAYGNMDNVKKYSNILPTLGFDLGLQLEFKKANANILVGSQLNYFGNKFSAYQVANGFEPVNGSSALTNNGVVVNSALSNLRTIGTKDNERIIKNTYLNVSLPIGVNFSYLNITKQLKLYGLVMLAPTYQIMASHYTMTANLKYYLKTESNLRKWNINTIAATYLEFNTKAFSWQIGPQIKYQLINIYSKDHYIKAKSNDVGLRIGIVKRF
jgi:hypothetical protein